jgi:hypothetical protein
MEVFFFFHCTQGLSLEPLHHLFFVMFYFRDRILQNICPSLLLHTTIHLISASCAAKITGVSHWCLAQGKSLSVRFPEEEEICTQG